MRQPLKSAVRAAANEQTDLVSATASGIDPRLREAMSMEIARFLVAFDAVLDLPDGEACDQLRTRIDRLMRTAARIRIELERAFPS
jgi:hypothetical protein